MTIYLIIYSSIGNAKDLTGKLISNRLFKHHPIAKPMPEFKNFRYLENIWKDCGELCNTSRDGLSGPYFNHVKANVQCKKLFGNEDFDRGHGEAHAPKKIPKELLQEFSMNGRVKMQKWYLDTKNIGGEPNPAIWSKNDIERHGVPYSSENDALLFNAHRVYGKIRYPYLTTNWHQFYEGHGRQRVFVFTK